MLDVQGLDTFYGRAQILHRVSLAVSRGEIVALLGRNGAGKSTTLKSVMGLVRPRAGTIAFRDRPLQGRLAYAACRLGLGYVPEDRRIFPDLTVQENLEVGRRPPRADAPDWSEEKLFALFPNLKERRRNLGSHLSGGEQQMLTIARTLMGNPLMILLDEPSEGIAPVIVEQMAHTVKALKSEGLTVLLSEQNLLFARAVADRAYIIEKGTIRYDGTMAALEAEPEVREKYLAV